MFSPYFEIMLRIALKNTKFQAIDFFYITYILNLRWSRKYAKTYSLFPCARYSSKINVINFTACIATPHTNCYKNNGLCVMLQKIS